MRKPQSGFSHTCPPGSIFHSLDACRDLPPCSTARCLMNDSLREYAAGCQTGFAAPKTRREIAARVDRMIEMIDSAVLGYEPFFPVRLVVFPEFAHSPPVYYSVHELLEQLAVPLPNEHTDRYLSR